MAGRVAFDQILAAVARQAGVTVDSILGPAVAANSRENWPRQRAVLFARRLRPDRSFPWLAQRLGGRDHGTVVACHQAGERRLALFRREQHAVKAVLADLGLEQLPPYRPVMRHEVAVSREIAATERRLAELRQRHAQLQERA